MSSKVRARSVAGWGPSELKRDREEMGLTQEQLALLLGITPMSISRWETGQHDMTHPVAINLAIRWLKRELRQAKQRQKGPERVFDRLVERARNDEYQQGSVGRGSEGDPVPDVGNSGEAAAVAGDGR